MLHHKHQVTALRLWPFLLPKATTGLVTGLLFNLGALFKLHNRSFGNLFVQDLAHQVGCGFVVGGYRVGVLVERDRCAGMAPEISDGNDHPIDAIRYAMMDDVLRGWRASAHPRFAVMLAMITPTMIMTAPIPW